MHSLLLSGNFFNVDISAGHFNFLQEVRNKVHYLVNTSITATCMFVEVSHALQLCQWLAVCRWFSAGTPISSTNKTYRHYIAEMLLKVALNTINQSNEQYFIWKVMYSWKGALFLGGLPHTYKQTKNQLIQNGQLFKH